MPGIIIVSKVIGDQALNKLDGLSARIQDLTPVMQDFAAYMVGSVQQNFEAQGRPDPWAPLKAQSPASWLASKKSLVRKKPRKGGGIEASGAEPPLTAAGQEARGGRLILTDTGRLRSSINFTSFALRVEGSTNVIYAAIQQLGGTIQLPEIRPVNKQALFWPGAPYPVKKVQAHKVTLPARPFLMFQEEEDIYGYLYPSIARYLEDAGE
jgi:phage gpG-like protein